MRVEIVEDAGQFAQRAWLLLAADEANHTHLLSAVQAARRADPLAGEPWRSALVVDDAGSRALAAACCQHQRWFLSTGPAEALQALGAALRSEPLAGYTGEAAAVRAFERGHGAAARVHFDLPIYRLDGAPRAVAPVAGGLQLATPDDLAVVQALSEAFRIEAGLADTAEQVARGAERRVRAGSLYLWRDAAGEVAGLIGGQRIAPTGARIGPVYTPPPRRGRGIGAAMVAALSQRLIDEGARTVFLFTDAANPTSNALYPRVGFMPAGRHLHLTVAG